MSDIYRPIRRKDRALPPEETLRILEEGSYGVLSTMGEDGRPTGVPLSYVLLDGEIYFHSAMQGEKTDNLAREARVGFCVVGPVQPIFAGTCTTLYESAVVHGRASLVQDEALKRRVLLALAQKYLPAHMDAALLSVEQGLAHTAVWRITPGQVTGKGRKGD